MGLEARSGPACPSREHPSAPHPWPLLRGRLVDCPIRAGAPPVRGRFYRLPVPLDRRGSASGYVRRPSQPRNYTQVALGRAGQGSLAVARYATGQPMRVRRTCWLGGLLYPSASPAWDKKSPIPDVRSLSGRGKAHDEVVAAAHVKAAGCRLPFSN